MQVVKLSEHIRPLDNETVKVKEAGNVIEILYQQKRSSGGYITKLDADHYIDNQTGEVKEFNRIQNRAQDKANIAKSMEMGRDILNANITDVKKCRWLTLTYKENMTDTIRILLDFKHFNQKMRQLYGKYEYITAVEPQGRGAWHFHVVMIFEAAAPYLSPQTVAETWGKGFVKIKRLDDVDNVGAYLTAYLGDVDISEYEGKKENLDIKTVEVENENGEKVTKRYVKGARLHMYPSGMHIFRWSRGIKRPIVTHMKEAAAIEKVSAATLTFEKTVKLSDPDRDYENLLNYRYYNKVRKQSQ